MLTGEARRPADYLGLRTALTPGKSLGRLLAKVDVWGSRDLLGPRCKRVCGARPTELPLPGHARKGGDRDTQNGG